jgi:hypothetical protein
MRAILIGALALIALGTFMKIELVKLMRWSAQQAFMGRLRRISRRRRRQKAGRCLPPCDRERSSGEAVRLVGGFAAMRRIEFAPTDRNCIAGSRRFSDKYQLMDLSGP